MSVLMRKPLTDGRTELKIIGTIEIIDKAIKALMPLGFEEKSDFLSWEEVFPESSPGTALKGARYKENVTQRQLSQMTGIPQRHISEMENNKRPIGKSHAKILGKALNVGYKIFLE